MSSFITKLMSFIVAVIFALSPYGKPELTVGTEVSTKLTQTPVVEGKLPIDPSLAVFDKYSEEGFVIPGLYEGFIPQGIFYVEEEEIFLISGYYKDKALPSRIILVDKEGNFIKSVGGITKKGNYTYGHFGGVAVFGDYVYIATTGVTHVFLLSEILVAEDEDYCLVHKALYTDTTCSFVNVCNGVMYIGEFVEDSAEEKKEATNVYTHMGQTFYARCNAFILDENAPWGIREDMIDSEGNLTPDFAFGIPLKAQGFAVLGNGRVVVTSSATPITNSNVYIYDDVTADEPEMLITVNGKEVPLYLLMICDRVSFVKAPTYLEEVTLFEDGSVYLMTESAAAPYIGKSKNPIDNVIKFDINEIN